MKNVIHWAPRILTILSILLISLFALDSFGPSVPLLRQISAFLMHLIPSAVLAAILVIAWRHRLTGGIIFIVIGLALSPFIYSLNFRNNNSIWMSIGIVAIITLPFIVAGLLFIIDYYYNRKEQSTT